jgi:hypothetical protein
MNTLDTRDLQEELDELETNCNFEYASVYEDDPFCIEDTYAPWIEENCPELQELLDLKEELEDSGWEYGITLIDTRDFKEYARELAEDLYGTELRDSNWPFTCIDWERAAHELTQDYSVITYGDDDYYYREA